jgi:hypothetical protein
MGFSESKCVYRNPNIHKQNNGIFLNFIGNYHVPD